MSGSWPKQVPRAPSRPGVMRGYRNRPHGTPTAVLTLPVVGAVGVGGLAATSVTLIGTVNPQGLDTLAWFTYGTTPAMGSTTAAVDVGSGTIPVTITATLTGLATTVVYYFAVVAQSTAGTVTSPALSFTPTAPTTSSAEPVVTVGQSVVNTPHFAAPFRFDPTKGGAVVEQDSLEDIASCVTAVVSCPQGSCPALGDFGYVSPAFMQEPVSAEVVATAIRQYEPRAGLSTISQLMNDGYNWQLTFDVSMTPPSTSPNAANTGG